MWQNSWRSAGKNRPWTVTDANTFLIVLTSRQHGVATVWSVVKQSFNYKITDPYRLLATLGSKSTLKKVTRKAILDVDVPKACGTIHDPSAPMALRLQANLLYVSSRTLSP
jgi:meiotic recombination protein REC8, fungi type